MTEYKIKTRKCSKCKNIFTLTNFYQNKNTGFYDTFCKDCRKLIKRDQHQSYKDEILEELLVFFSRWPQFNYSQEHSLAIFAIINKQNWLRALRILNTKFNCEYEYKHVHSHLFRIKDYVYRFFTYKQCKNCKKIKQTYVNSDNLDYVFKVLEDITIPIVPSNFEISKGSRDGWRQNCKPCDLALAAYGVQKGNERRTRLRKNRAKKRETLDELFEKW